MSVRTVMSEVHQRLDPWEDVLSEESSKPGRCCAAGRPPPVFTTDLDHQRDYVDETDLAGMLRCLVKIQRRGTSVRSIK